jgi:signal transduction histidine kinase
MVMRSQAEVSLKSQHYKTWLESTISHIDQLNRLIDTLLQLETRASESMILEDCTIEPMINSIIDDTSSTYTDKKINLTLNLLPNLVKHAHRGSLEIILRNLIDNAYKYTPEQWTITITADTHIIKIVDTWEWIPADQIDHIWEPFWQADTSKWQDHGLWLGLALVHSLVTQLGWTIDVESSTAWTTFTLRTTS